MAQDKILDVEIVTPQKVLFSGKAVSVTVPGSKSPFQVLFNHAPIVSSLDLGMVRIVDNSNKKLFFATSEGFTEVRKNRVSILVEKADDAANMDPDEIDKELKSALDTYNSSQDQTVKDQAHKKVIIAENKLVTLKKFREMK